MRTGYRASEIAASNGEITVTAESKDDDEIEVQGDELLVALGRRPNTDGIDLSLNGNQIGEPFDSYNSETIPSDRINYGEFSLLERKHTITITIIGKSPNATGYYAGIDLLSFNLTKH